MKKIFFVIFLLLIICTSFTACNPSIKLLGKWRIIGVETGKVDMDQEDVQEMGGLDLGYIKINKSGSCEMNFLGDEYDGTWSGSGTDAIDANTQLTFQYSGDKRATATFEGDTMIVEAEENAVYKLEK